MWRKLQAVHDKVRNLAIADCRHGPNFVGTDQGEKREKKRKREKKEKKEEKRKKKEKKEKKKEEKRKKENFQIEQA